MKKLLLALALILAPLSLKAESKLFTNFGGLNIYIPLTQVDVIYQYDFVGKRSLVGGETNIASWKQLTFTGGAVTSVDGQGSPFLGMHLSLTNPAESFIPLANVHPGLFGGRDFHQNAWIFGIKASVNVF